MKKAAPLFADLKVGQSILIDGGRITITLEQKSGQTAKLKIQAEENTPISVPGKIKTGATQAAKGIEAVTSIRK
jgi:pyruvate kinase